MIFNASRVSNLLLCGALILFTFTINAPSLAAQIPINPVDISFGIKAEKLLGKINKYKKGSEPEKLIDVMLDLKSEVETYTGQKINVDRQLDRIEDDIVKAGGKLKKDEMKQIRKLIKERENRSDHKAMYIAACIEHDIPYCNEEEHCLFVAKSVQDTIDVPHQITNGVTVALSGSILNQVPLQLCKAWASDLTKTGVSLAVKGANNREVN